MVIQVKKIIILNNSYLFLFLLIALILACQRGHEEIVQMLLLHDEIDVNHKNNKGKSALWHAHSKGRDDMVCLLLCKEGIDTSVCENNDDEDEDEDECHCHCNPLEQAARSIFDDLMENGPSDQRLNEMISLAFQERLSRDRRRLGGGGEGIDCNQS